MMLLRALASAALLAALAIPASAQVAMQGSFVASKACPALLSIKKGTNPGTISVEAGKSYTLLGKNKGAATYYWIEVPGAAPLQRWVAVDCGAANGEAAGGTTTTAGGGTAPTDGKPFYVLALSWEPAFCEGLPDKAECKAETPEGFDSTHFSLHGLWPQPRSKELCGVDPALKAADDGHRWQDLPEPTLTPATKAALDRVMPGTQSQLERHEWIKHGTCYPGADAETYFKDEIRLIDAVNASPVQLFFAGNAGLTVQTADIRASFDKAFGAGAGERVRVSCKDDGSRRLIVELTIGLKGDISAGTPLAGLIAASSPTKSGCNAGIIDTAGLQ